MKLIVAIKERSAGNESVGAMWMETAVFDAATSVEVIQAWADKQGQGKLIITAPTIQGIVEEYLNDGALAHGDIT